MRVELCAQREQAESQLRAQCEELRMQSRRVQQQLQEELAKLQQHCTESLLQAESHKQQVCVCICVSVEHSQNLLTTSFQSDHLLNQACLLPCIALNHLQSEHGADGITVSWFYHFDCSWLAGSIWEGGREGYSFWAHNYPRAWHRDSCPWKGSYA